MSSVQRPSVRYDLVVGEHDAVEEVDLLAVSIAIGAHRRETAAASASRSVEPHVAQGDVRLDRLELDAQSDGVAEAAVGVGEGGEQVGVLAVRTCGDDLAVAGEDVHLDHGLVRQPVAERRRLDAEAGYCAPERDGPQLGNDQRHQAVRQRRIDQVLVGAHALDVGAARVGVDSDHAVEPGDVEAGDRLSGAGAEQIRGLLCQPNRLPGGDGGIRRAQRSTAASCWAVAESIRAIGATLATVIHIISCGGDFERHGSSPSRDAVEADP